MTHPPYQLGLNQQFSSRLAECCVEAEALKYPKPQLLYFNEKLASQFDANFPRSDDALAALFSGQEIPTDAKPIAQAYAGHQFGHFNPQLGDGRAMVLGELKNNDGKLFELDLKGSGPTVFSRGGDGKAALGPMLREVLISEAMAAYSVPSTRSLAVVSTGETVYRDPPQAGAVLARTSASQIRIGTFQFFAARDQYDVIKKLVDFSIERHFPELLLPLMQHQTNTALAFLNVCISAQAKLIAQWMGLGFIHGVMNTDNMLIGAETIDYGPCAFMDTYDPKTVFSSIDRNSRYAYMNQPSVTQWNLSRFAETLLPLIADGIDDGGNRDEDSLKEQAIELATQAVQSFIPQYEQTFRLLMCDKLGIDQSLDVDTANLIIDQWQQMLFEQKLDWTLSHYYLTEHVNTHASDKVSEDATAVKSNAVDAANKLLSACSNKAAMKEWLTMRQTHSSKTVEQMKKVNPAIIPRNHLVEEALQLAQKQGDLSAFNALLTNLQSPFEWPSDIKYTQPAGQKFNDEFMTFCGT
ncbi:YdiU family protein [Glaciecola siphonariae]|uniref:Protein nucleotidyltransferase YdiU n=1 Tax=Glaciecola siphonariae TaxID=521012 RepID=A0ABV9LTE5_9ALTE